MTTTRNRSATPQPPVVPVKKQVAAIDALRVEDRVPKAYRISQLQEATRESMIRALARGISPEAIGRALQESGEVIDPKVVRNWARSEEIVKRVEALRKKQQGD